MILENGRIELNVPLNCTELIRVDQKTTIFDNMGSIVNLIFKNVSVDSKDKNNNLIGVNYGTIGLTTDNLSLNGLKNILVPDDKNIEFTIGNSSRRINNILNITTNARHREYKSGVKTNYNTTLTGNVGRLDTKTAFDGGRSTTGKWDKNGYLKGRDIIHCENIGISGSTPRIDHMRISGISNQYYGLNKSADSTITNYVLLTTTSGSTSIQIIPNLGANASAYVILQYSVDFIVGLTVKLIGCGASGADLITYITDVQWDDTNKVINVTLHDAPQATLTSAANSYFVIHPDYFYSPLIRYADNATISSWISNYADIQSEDLFLQRTMTIGNYYAYVHNGTRAVGVAQMGAIKGATAQRPTFDKECGYLYFDTTLATNGKPIWWNGTSWVDATGTIV